MKSKPITYDFGSSLSDTLDDRHAPSIWDSFRNLAQHLFSFFLLMAFMFVLFVVLPWLADAFARGLK